MYRCNAVMWILVVLVVVGAREVASSGSFVDLLSNSRPISTCSAAGLFTVFHEDGTVSFTDSQQTIFAAILNPEDRGGAYMVIGSSSTSVTLLATNSTHANILKCSASSMRCAKTGQNLALPISGPNAPIIHISNRGQNSEMVGTYILASKDSVIVLSTGSSSSPSLTIPKGFSITFTTNVTAIHPKMVTGTYISGNTGILKLFIAYSADSKNPTQPGMIVNLCWNGGMIGKRLDCDGEHPKGDPIITYLTVSPLNFWVPQDFDSARVWMEQDGTATIHPASAFSSSYTLVTVPLTPGNVISPTFLGEYKMTQVGVMAIGSQNPNQLGWTRQCLSFQYAFGMSTMGVRITKSNYYPPSSGTGAPFLAIQPNRMIASLTGVAKTSNGYGVISVSFADCPMGGFAEEVRLQVSSSSSEELQGDHQLAAPLCPPIASIFRSNCAPANCNTDTSGDCNGNCWSCGAVGGFFCCRHTPTF